MTSSDHLPAEKDTDTIASLDQQLTILSATSDKLRDYLVQHRPAALPQPVYDGIYQVASGIAAIQRQVISLEEERRSLRALAQIGQVVNSSLELDEVLQIVMDTIIRLSGAERGFLMLSNPNGDLVMRVARNWEQESLENSELTVSRTIINRTVQEGQPLLTTNAQEDPRFEGQQSIVAYNLRSILCVPLRVKGAVTGVIYADNRVRSGIFSKRELDLLAAFANQAAVAIENARLFASVKATLAEVTELKNLMDNVFESIASGVLTADLEERIQLCNRAAEGILGQASEELVGKSMNQVLTSLTPALNPQLYLVMKNNEPVLGLEVSPNIPSRGLVDLRLSMTPLKDVRDNTQGVAIVMEDLTEKKRLEAQRKLFERMVSPAVIDQLDPNSLSLGGKKTEITALFADIRGFTSFSESVSAEYLVSVLNQYLAAAADCVLREEGTIDKFLGDAVMAWFNAPIPQADHTLRAVRAALGIRDAVAHLHGCLSEDCHLSFGVGIHTGEAVLGLVGTERRLEYTAIGDCVNTAKRIQENSAANQILISHNAYRVVANDVQVKPVEPIQAKGKKEPVFVYEVIGLK